MPHAYLEDLRWRFVWLYLFLNVSAEVARIMHVSERTVSAEVA